MLYQAMPQDVFLCFWKNRSLVWQLTKRDVIGRYRGSMFGILWSVFNPILMLAVYTFVFNVVFKARWSNNVDESKTEFAIILFAGMIVFNLFSECVNRAPNLIVSNANYVKKVVFPLEVLPGVVLCSAIFHMLISFTVLIVFVWLTMSKIHWTLIYVPFVCLPLIFGTLGLCWLFASLGVYLRDIAQTIGIITTMIMFLSPIFFPVSSLPPMYQGLIRLNPLSFLIEQMRNVTIWGQQPDFVLLCLYTLSGFGMAWLGLMWFQKSRKGFADVL